MRVHFLSFSWCFLLLQLGLTFQATSTFGEANVTSSVVVPAAGITGKTIETAGEGKRKAESAGAETREKRETYDDEMYGYGDDSYQTENTYGGNAPEYAEVNENYEEYTVPAPQEPTGVYSEVEGTDDGYGQYQQPYGADQVTGTSYGEDDGTETEDDEGEMDQSEGYGYEEPPSYQYSGDGDYYGESRDVGVGGPVVNEVPPDQKTEEQHHETIPQASSLSTGETAVKADTPPAVETAVKADTPSAVETAVKADTPSAFETPVKADTPSVVETPVKVETKTAETAEGQETITVQPSDHTSEGATAKTQEGTATGEIAPAPKSLVAYGLAQALNRRYNQGSYKSAAVSSSYKSSNSYQQNQGAYRTSSYRKPVPLPVPLPYKSIYKRPTSPVYKPAYKEPAYPVNEYEPEHEPQYGGGYQEETEETDGYATKYEEPAEYVDKKEDYTAPGYSYGDAMPTENDGADTYNAGDEKPAAYDEDSEYVPKKKPIAPKKQYPAAGKGYGKDYDPCKKKNYPGVPAADKYKEEKKSKYTPQPAKYPQTKPKPVKPGYKKMPPAYPQTPQYTKAPEVPEYLPEYQNKEEGDYTEGSTNYPVEEADYEKAPVAEYQPTKIQYQPKKPDSYEERPASPNYPKKPVMKGLSGRFGLGGGFGFPAGGFGGFGGAIGGSATTLIVDEDDRSRSRSRSRSRRSKSSRGRNEDRQTIRDLQAQVAALQRSLDREKDKRQQAEAARDRAQDHDRRDRAEASRQRSAARAQAAFAQCLLNTFNNLRNAVQAAAAAATIPTGSTTPSVPQTTVSGTVTSNPNNCVQPVTA